MMYGLRAVERQGDMRDQVRMQLGERRRICISVTSCNRQPFEVTSAKYVLRVGSDTETSGECELEQKSDSEVILSVVIQPQRKNTIYTLEYTYEIPPEILIHDVSVSVY